MAITFNYADRKLAITDKTQLKALIKEIFNFNNVGLDNLMYVFCSDEFLLGINQQFLNHNYYTDIITFNLSSEERWISGEIYISVDRVRDNANRFGISLKEEIHRVIFHGALHLCGFKDKSKADKAVMTNAENFWLSKYFNQ